MEKNQGIMAAEDMDGKENQEMMAAGDMKLRMVCFYLENEVWMREAHILAGELEEAGIVCRWIDQTGGRSASEWNDMSDVPESVQVTDSREARQNTCCDSETILNTGSREARRNTCCDSETILNMDSQEVRRNACCDSETILNTESRRVRRNMGCDSETILITDSREAAREAARRGIVCIACTDDGGFFEGAQLVVEGLAELEPEVLEEFLLRTQGFPVTIARTERLVIREIAEEDFARLRGISMQAGMEHALRGDGQEGLGGSFRGCDVRKGSAGVFCGYSVQEGSAGAFCGCDARKGSADASSGNGGQEGPAGVFRGCDARKGSADVPCGYSVQEGPDNAFCGCSAQDDDDDTLPQMFSDEYLSMYIKYVYKFYGYGLWSVFLHDGTLIGCCGFCNLDMEVPDGEGNTGRDTGRRCENEELGLCNGRDGQEGTANVSVPAVVPRRLELQYMLAREAQGYGYAQEMCRAALRFAFARTDAEEVWVCVHRDNAPSVRLAERLGFSRVNGSGAKELLYYRLSMLKYSSQKADVK